MIVFLSSRRRVQLVMNADRAIRSNQPSTRATTWQRNFAFFTLSLGAGVTPRDGVDAQGSVKPTVGFILDKAIPFPPRRRFLSATGDGFAFAAPLGPRSRFASRSGLAKLHHILERYVSFMSRDHPNMPERIPQRAKPVAPLLVRHRLHRFRARGDRAFEHGVRVLDVNIKMHRRAAQRLRTARPALRHPLRRVFGAVV